MGALIKIFQMFDKLDDIIYEPVKVVCDAFRQPLKELDARNERRKIELESEVRLDEEKFRVELELYKRQGDIDIEANMRKMNAEIDNMIANNELERQSQIVEAIKRYQKDLGEASVELSNSIGRMSIELRERAYKLVDERTKEYSQMQKEAQDSAMTRLEDLEQRFPNGGKSKEIMENAIEKQLNNIIDNANNFICAMQNDIAKMAANIDQITAQAINNSDKYLSPMTAKALASPESPLAIDIKKSNQY